MASIYRFWGRRPGGYAASDWLPFLGRYETIRRRSVDVLQLMYAPRSA